jgi:hypothetical protein
MTQKTLVSLSLGLLLANPSPVRSMSETVSIDSPVSANHVEAATEILKRVHLFCALGEHDKERRSQQQSKLIEQLPQHIAACDGPVGYVPIVMEHRNQYGFRSLRAQQATLFEFMGAIRGQLWGDKEMGLFAQRVNGILMEHAKAWFLALAGAHNYEAADTSSADPALIASLAVREARFEPEKPMIAATELVRRFHHYCAKGEEDEAKRMAQRKVLITNLASLIHDYSFTLSSCDTNMDDYVETYGLKGRHGRSIRAFLRELYPQFLAAQDHDSCAFVLKMLQILDEHEYNASQSRA